MTKNNVRIAGVAMPVIIAMLLLVAGSSRLTASDQPSAANVGETSIISFLGRRRSR
jgi:hypothetical protein